MDAAEFIKSRGSNSEVTLKDQRGEMTAAHFKPQMTKKKPQSGAVLRTIALRGPAFRGSISRSRRPRNAEHPGASWHPYRRELVW